MAEYTRSYYSGIGRDETAEREKAPLILMKLYGAAQISQRLWVIVFGRIKSSQPFIRT